MENVASQFLTATASGFGIGVAIAIGVDIFILGGRTYFAMASAGAFGAASLSGVAYIVATAGTGLIVAGAVAGTTVAIKSIWKYKTANKEAVDLLLDLMEKGKGDLI